MEGGKEQNYWPGFVDALSNVVLTLIFVLVVFVFALMIASNKLSKRMVEITQTEQRQKAEQEEKKQTAQTTNAAAAEATQKLAQAQQQIAVLQKELAQSQQACQGQSGEAVQPSHAAGTTGKGLELTVDKEATPTPQQGQVSIGVKTGNIHILYPLAVVNLDEKSMAKLKPVLLGLKKAAGQRILLRSVMGSESYSTARRLAYYRALLIRNTLIASGIGSKESIRSVIVQPATPGTGEVEIVVGAKP